MSRPYLGMILASGATVLGLDQLTKWWALEALDGGNVVDLVGSLRLNLAFNTGTAFSIGSGANLGPFIAVLALVVVALLIRNGLASRQRLGAVCAGLVAGGSLGNLVDRAFREGDGFLGGAVVDFIDLQWWPIFNLADAAIVVGALLFVVVGLRADVEPRS